jgi:predicted RNA binding protein YcfA (HicA-like mRNA interferase family)
LEKETRYDWTDGMGRKLPKLKPREVKANIKALGFVWKRTDGSHETWERLPDKIITTRKTVQVDVGKAQFDDFLMKMMIRQSGFSRDEFCTGVMKSVPAAAAIPAAEKSK